MQTPFLSVCIPAYNRAESIGNTLESILGQTFQDFEIVVVDNHSDDNTEEIVASFKDERIRFIRNDWNIGAARNHNRCLMEAKGKYVKFLHSDDVLITADVLQKMIDAACKYPEAAMITCGFRFGSHQNPFALPFDLLRPKGFSTVRESMNIHNFGLPSEWLIKKDALMYTGLLIDSHICDVDLVMKIVYYFNSYAIAEPLIEHRFHGESETSIASRMNGWEFMRFRVLEQLPFYSQLSGERKAILSSYLHMTLMQKIKDAIANESYHQALQGVLDLLRTDPHLRFFEEEDREKVLHFLLDQLVYRQTPSEIFDFMIGQQYSKPYADFFKYGFAFNYQLYRLERKLKETPIRICIIGSGYLTKLFLQTFPGLKDWVGHIIETDVNNSDMQLLEGIPITKDSFINFNDTFAIIASDTNIRHHRYELIRAGLIEGEHFLPVLEII